MRGFKVCKGYENSDITLPKRGTKFSAGYDIESAEDVVIEPGCMVMIKTGIKAYMQEDEVLKVYPRSSIGIKKNLMMAKEFLQSVVTSNFCATGFTLQSNTITPEKVTITPSNTKCLLTIFLPKKFRHCLPQNIFWSIF